MRALFSGLRGMGAFRCNWSGRTSGV
jgi:hypothetical protein